MTRSGGAPRSGDPMTDHQRSTPAAGSPAGSPQYRESDPVQPRSAPSRTRRTNGRERADLAPLALDAPHPSPSHEPEISEERLDPEAIRVIARLRHAGHQAHFVGGCVRDVLLGRTPKDFDVATSAHPGEVRATFRNCRLIGRRFRLAHVYFRGPKVIEVATFRKNPIDTAEDVPDGDLLITRDNVFGTAEEDARRRDFTVNGLFYDVFAGEVIDYVGGRADLEAHRIATIGDPEIRMREDPVRALRAMRFASRLGFTIEPETFAAMRRHASELGRCAPPRLLEELFKILRCGSSARAFELLRSSGALPVLLPALASPKDAGPDDFKRRLLHLVALDELVRAGEEPSEAVLLGALLLHLPPGEPGEASGRDALRDALVTTARLPRRIAERTRLALVAQRAFRGQVRRRRRGLAAQAYFIDALQLLRVSVGATGEGEELLAEWQDAAGAEGGRTADALPDDHPAAEEDAGAGPRAVARQSQDGDVSLERRPRRGSRAPRGVSGDVPGEVVATSAPAPTGAEEGGMHRRRRRGGRRRGRRGGAPASAPQA